MRPIGQEAPVLRRGLLLIVGLIAVSTVLFVIGVTVERRGEAAEGVGAHQELSSEPVHGAPVQRSPREIKNLLRKAAARSKEALVEAIGVALSVITAQDARGFLEHAGYRPTGHLL